jgi:hypothetical protein
MWHFKMNLIQNINIMLVGTYIGQFRWVGQTKHLLNYINK